MGQFLSHLNFLKNHHFFKKGRLKKKLDLYQI
jgi:hypothetical protein